MAVKIETSVIDGQSAVGRILNPSKSNIVKSAALASKLVLHKMRGKSVDSALADNSIM